LNTPNLQLDASLLAAANLSGHESQRLFQVLLQSISRPGTPYALLSHESPRQLPITLVPLLALLGYQTPFCIHGGEREMLTVITSRATGALGVDIADAAYIAFLHQPDALCIADIRRSNDRQPENAAQVIVSIDAEITVDATATEFIQIRLEGPGIDGCTHIVLRPNDDFNSSLFRQLVTPGIRDFDMWLIDTAGNIFGVSRTTSVEYITIPSKELSK
jgi:alpha-D-ribose 1-methylphosphonate 5-triphosphate synthase subunit PhnH